MIIAIGLNNFTLTVCVIVSSFILLSINLYFIDILIFIASYLFDKSNILNDYGDKLLYEMSHYKPEMDPIFDAEEWQIKVSPAVIEAGPDAATYSVNVSSKSDPVKSPYLIMVSFWLFQVYLPPQSLICFTVR